MKNRYTALFIAFGISFAFAQKDDTVKTEVVNVATSYNPTISDAFKLKENPQIDSEESKKKKVEYKIFEKPINSVFVPNTGGYVAAEKAKSTNIYPNYLKIGYGNYNTPLLEGFVHKEKREHLFDFYLYSKSSNGDIEEAELKNNYLNTKIGAAYTNKQRYHSWRTNIGFKRDQYNWYGLPGTKDDYAPIILDDTNPKQNYNTFTLGGDLNLENGMLKQTSIAMTTFTDNFNSKESKFFISPQFEFPMGENKIVTDFKVEIVNGKFKNEFDAPGMSKSYGQMIIGTEASYPIQKKNFFFAIGGKIKYNSDFEFSTNEVKFYPDLKIDYVIIDELLSVYGGWDGDLQQNSYEKFATANPFVSPDLLIKPTDLAYNIHAGIQGKLSSTIAYNAKASYKKENDKALFLTNKSYSDGTIPPDQPYKLGNSFTVVYDDVSTFGLFGEITAQLQNDFAIGANLAINSFNTTNEEEAWNLPTSTTKIFGTHTFGKWTSGAEMYIVGKRNDMKTYDPALALNNEPVFLKAYADLNLHTNYQFNPQWNAFLELNNVLNNNYERFANFNTQGFQILGGVKYNFDF